MSTEELIDEIRNSGQFEVIWKALCVAKVRSSIIHKTGIDQLEIGSINPSIIEFAMNEVIDFVSDDIIKKQGERN